jgi:sugar phosphate isomerase/epimerase
MFPPLEQPYLVNIADPKMFDKNVRIINTLFRVGKILGADVVGMHGGYRRTAYLGDDYFGFHRVSFGKDIGEKEGMNTIERIVEESVGIAEEAGIRFCIENDTGEHANGYAMKPEDFEWILSLSKSKMFGMLFDIGHAHVAAKTLGFDEYDFAKAFKDRIIEMHLHDCNAHGDTHTVVGTGVIDFARYFESVGPRVRDIPMVFEYTNRVSVEEAMDSKKRVEDMLAKI